MFVKKFSQIYSVEITMELKMEVLEYFGIPSSGANREFLVLYGIN